MGTGGLIHGSLRMTHLQSDFVVGSLFTLLSWSHLQSPSGVGIENAVSSPRANHG